MSDDRPAVLVVDADITEVAGPLGQAGYTNFAVPALSDGPLGGEGSPVVLLGGDVRHVGLGELGVPVDDFAAVDGALVRGAHDIDPSTLRPFDPWELVARIKAAERYTTSQRALAELNRTDALTGLSTRRRLDEHLE
ncbi:MAG: hypothetical protein M3Q68_04130, partial [Actinomycetota bacterium]|nr:hypothetical protein [Actinomycetota bacterium]